MSLLDEITEEVEVDEVDLRLEQRRMALINQINEYLEEKGWDQSDLAEKMGKENSQITRLLSPTTNPTLKTIVEIESALERNLFTVHRNLKYKFDFPSQLASQNVFSRSHQWETKKREEGRRSGWVESESEQAVFEINA